MRADRRGLRALLYETHESAEGLLIAEPAAPEAPGRVTRRVAMDLSAQPWPTRPVMPWTEAVHDRAEIEIARGCTRGCRFCQAGMIYRPVRERDLDTLVEQAEAIIDATGYDELSLLSLNCPDYTRIVELIDRLHERLAKRRVSVSLPSCRWTPSASGSPNACARAQERPDTRAGGESQRCAISSTGRAGRAFRRGARRVQAAGSA